MCCQAHHPFRNQGDDLVATSRIWPLVSRMLHDRTANKIAGAVNRIPGATAQIIAYDVGSRIAEAIRAR